MKSTKIIIKTKSKSYPIYFGENVINLSNNLIKQNLPKVKKIFIITDKNLPSFVVKKLSNSLKKYDLKIHRLSVSEKIKNLKVAEKLIESMLRFNFNRSDCVIALGGGVIGDLAAFTSSLMKRGIKFINIPSTLLAQVDASIGGKTGVNSNQGKNLIGTFYQPDLVLTDVSLLNSLPRREMISGYGEILKHSLISNKKFFLWLNKNAENIINKKNKNILKDAIIKSCKIKSVVVKKDETEKNLRMILNFGHTFAHGFEAAKKYSKKLNHGEAVLLGMMVAIKLSHEKKKFPFKDLMLIQKHYDELGLPMKISNFFKKSDISKIITYMKKDKKNLNDKINLILLKKIGKVNNFSLTAKSLKKFLLNIYS